MDQLFIDLKTAINNFLAYGEQAFSKLSDYGKKEEVAGYLPGSQHFWRKVLAEATKYYQGYVDYLVKNQDEEALDTTQLSAKIAFYRSMSRWIGECPPEWSAYYTDIRQYQAAIAKTIYAIDTKYELKKYK